MSYRQKDISDFRVEFYREGRHAEQSDEANEQLDSTRGGLFSPVVQGEEWCRAVQRGGESME